MTMLTVDDLARDLKVRNEDLVKELVIMGFEVEGPESPLETDDPVGLRAQLVTVFPPREIVEQRIKPTVIRRRMKHSPEAEAQEQPIPEAPEAAGAQPSESVATRTVVEEKAEDRAKAALKKVPKKMSRPEPARIIEMAPKVVPPTKVEKELKTEVRAKTQTVHGKEMPAKPEVAAKREPMGKPGEAAAAPSAPSHEAVTEPEKISAPAESLVPEVHAGAPEAADRIAPEIKSEIPVEVAKESIALKAEAPEPSPDARSEEERPAKKKKKKERRTQPAQIIGRVELKKEPPKEPEPPEVVPAPVVVFPATFEKAQPVPRVVPKVLTAEEEAARAATKRKEKRLREPGGAERVEEDKTGVRRRKEVLLRAELYEDRRPGRGRGKGKKPKLRKPELTTPKAIKRRVKLPDLVTVAGLAHKMSVKAAEVIQHLIVLGVTATMNDPIDYDTATIVASEFGFEAEPTERSEGDILHTRPEDTAEELLPRSPVVTVMGHVDHGKTSLLDAIRSTRVTDQEAGGITQHIGAYKVRVGKGEVVFLDTPGHEAFTAMRARGAQVTDFVILVVAADDGVMDQTREAVNHAQAAKVPIIVAVNKMDKPDADKDRVIRELSEFGLIPESWGGETLFVYGSAKTGQGIDELLDLILLQAEMMELKANPSKPAVGTVIEARLDKGKGPVGTVLVREGKLKLGDAFIAGTHYGKVRAMLDQEGHHVSEAGPSTPVEVQGFSTIPEAGDFFLAVEDERIAKQVTVQRQQKQRVQETAAQAPATLEDLMARMQEQEIKELDLIVKADVQGSVEALRDALVGIVAQEIKVKCIHTGVGGITESDVMLASASRAIIIGFNVRPTPKASQLAEQERIDIRLYTVIYEVIEDVRKAMEGMLAPIEKEIVLGRAEIRQTFSVSRIGFIAGCYVVSGKIERSNQVRLIRDDVVVYQGRIVSMKRFKDDIKEASEGYECGIVLENYRDIKVGDVIEAFTIEKESAKLADQASPAKDRVPSIKS